MFTTSSVGFFTGLFSLPFFIFPALAGADFLKISVFLIVFPESLC